MKTTRIWMAALLALVITLTGCTTTTTDPNTGQPVKTYDPAKTEQVKAAIEPALSGALRRVLNNNKKHGPEIAAYMGGVAGVFCKMKDTKQFAPAFLIEALNALPQAQNIGDETVLDVKNALVSIYKIAYADRGRAELSEEKWLYHVADLNCQSINQALVDAGYPGVR